MYSHFQFGGATAANAYYQANWAVTDWYLNAVTGNDSNDGLTAGSALRTCEELGRRLGDGVIRWSHNVKVHVAEGAYGTLILVYALTAGNIEFDILGEPTTVVATGTVAAYAAAVHAGAAPTGTQVTFNGIADVTPYVGRIIYNVTKKTAVALAKANPHAAGLNVGRVSIPTNNFTNSTTWAVNDVWAVYNLPTFVHLNLTNIGADLFAAGGNYTTVQLIKVTGGMGLYGGSGGQYAWACECIADLYGGDAISNGNPFFCSCYVKPFHELLPVGASFLNCLIVGSTGTANSASYVGIGAHSPSFITKTLLQGLRLRCESGSVILDNVQAFDAPAVAIECEEGVSVSVNNNLSGRDNVVGLRLRSNTQLVQINAAGVVNLLGTTQIEVQSSTTTYNALTWANGMPYADGSAAGTATIGATAPGYVDVVVPVVDWTRQRLTAFPKDLAGVTGILSAPTAQRTATGFRLLSTNIADASAVDWQISPLGQNVWINKRP